MKDIPETGRLQALQSIMLLMPDENREALHYLLLFLSEVAKESDTNQVRQSGFVMINSSFASKNVCMTPVGTLNRKYSLDESNQCCFN